MFVQAGFTACFHLRAGRRFVFVLVWVFCKRNSRQTLSGKFNNMRETKQIPGTNYLKFSAV